jgi:hypothetical protein
LIDRYQKENQSRVQTTWTDDLHLVKAWELVSLDVVAGKDEISKKYLQRIDDKFHREMHVHDQ